MPGICKEHYIKILFQLLWKLGEDNPQIQTSLVLWSIICGSMLISATEFWFDFFSNWKLWGTGNCLDDIWKQWGYKHILQNSSYSRLCDKRKNTECHYVLTYQGCPLKQNETLCLVSSTLGQIPWQPEDGLSYWIVPVVELLASSLVQVLSIWTVTVPDTVLRVSAG